MRIFLPTLAPAANAQPDRFSDENARFLGDLGANMPVTPSESEGRVPSPISRAYVFYANLYARGLDVPSGQAAAAQAGGTGAPTSAGRLALQREARRTFRGMLALFALRRVLGIEVVMQGQHLSATPGSLSDVLLTALRAAPGGERFWNPLRYFKVKHGTTSTLFAGLSPLTGFFPSGKAPEQLPGVFWYEYDDRLKAARWYDPTSGVVSSDKRTTMSDVTLNTVRQLMAAWLRYAEQHLRPGFLDAVLVDRSDQDLFLAELRRWSEELRTVQVPEGVQVLRTPMSGISGVGHEASYTSQQPVELFEAVVDAPGAFLLSDFPLSQGRLLVSLNELALGHTRVYGRRFGGHETGAAAQRLPERGDDLGMALGWGPHTAPVPFIVVDQLFTPRLTLLSPHRRSPAGLLTSGLNPEWKGMEVDMGGGERETALFPFKPSALEVFSSDDLQKATASLSHDGRLFSVVLPLPGGRVVRHTYHNGEGDYRLDDTVASNTLDLRLFPNFDLDSVREYLPTYNGTQPDAVYYARVRLHPTWKFETVPVDARGQTIGSAHAMGSFEMPSGGDGNRSAGRADFHQMTDKPHAFSLKDRGLVFVALRSNAVEGVAAANWAVGVDFGTSNTCVSYKVLDGTEAAAPRVLTFQPMTTTLLAAPSYVDDLDGQVMEGAGAQLDFFPTSEAALATGDAAAALNRYGYFPSQVVTQQEAVPTRYQGFHLSKGLLYARNLSIVEPRQIDLIRGMVPIDSYGANRKIERRFILRRNIKWKEKDWLLVFLQHLRKMVVLTAALKRARVTEVRFSYPKSFGVETRTTFVNNFKRAWSDADSLATGSIEGEGQVQQLAFRPMSESEATKGRLVKRNMPVVVIDIGGGTTDITGFRAGGAIFQTSFLLSAGHLNRYVSASKALREALQEPVQSALSVSAARGEDLTMIKRHFTEGADGSGLAGGTEMMWFAILQALEDRPGAFDDVMLNLRIAEGNPAQKRAVEGFFLSAALLFGGLAYLAGYLTRKASEAQLGGADALRGADLRIEMTGNGSKLYRLLSGGEGAERADFHPVFIDLFLAGMRQTDADLGVPNVTFEGLYRHDGAEAPKVTVALGLLETDAKDSVIPLFQGVGEEGLDTDRALDYYRGVNDNRTTFRAPDEAPKLLRHFLDVLDDRLRHGRNRGFRVVPLAQSTETWAEDLLPALYAKARVHTEERILDTAAIVPSLSGIEEHLQPALEPLFVSELAGLLDAVREVYANPST